MGRQNHFERVRHLVSAHSGVPGADITPETRLFEDLRMASDRGAELLAAFGDEFRVDIRAVDPLNYFDDRSARVGTGEILAIGAALLPPVRARVRHAARGLRTLRVRDLVASARARRWIRPPIARSEAIPLRMSARAWMMLALGLAIPVVTGAHVWRGDGNLASALAAGLLALAAVAALLAIRLLIALRWLRRLDEAASREDQGLSGGA